MSFLNNYDSSFECKYLDIDEKREPGELLEESWFFGNLLDRKSKMMLRSLSDPCTSSNLSQQIGKSYEETYESIKKLSPEFIKPNLIKAPSLPASIKRQDSIPRTKQSFDHNTTQRSNKSIKKVSSSNLHRAPSLPSSLKTEDIQDEDVEFSMGKLIRQASMKNNNSSNTLPPRTNASKGVAPNSSLSRQQSRNKTELQAIKLETFEEMTITPPQSLKPRRLKPQMSLNDLDLQGFKDLGLDSDKGNSTTNPITITSLQENKNIEEYQGKRPIRRTNSKAWRGHSSAPPVPKWGGKKSTEDMKAQIKFWARAVASNVRQEC